jgi:hypothetical protein
MPTVPDGFQLTLSFAPPKQPVLANDATEPTVADQSQVLVPLHPVALPIAPPAPPPRVTIKDWPRADRPRDKLLDRGPGTLSDAELLAIILGSGSAGISALDQGRTIMQRFPDFRHLATVGAGDLCSITGLGPTKAAQILAAIEMAKRYGEQEFRPGEPLRGSGDVYSHFRERLASEQREVFYAVLLDNKNFGKTGTREQIVHIQTIEPTHKFAGSARTLFHFRPMSRHCTRGWHRGMPQRLLCPNMAERARTSTCGGHRIAVRWERVRELAAQRWLWA